MDLRWFNYTDAMKFLDLAVSHNILKREGKNVMPAFDHRKAELPATFRPSPDLLKARRAAAEGRGKRSSCG